MNLIKKLLPAFFLLYLVACQSTQTPSVMKIPTPENGKATVTGQVKSTKTNKPLQQVTMQLASVVHQNGQSAFVLDASHAPFCISDDNGNFAFTGVNPGEYLVVVGSVENQHYKVMTNDASQDKSWVAEANKVLTVGDLQVDLDQPPLPSK